MIQINIYGTETHINFIKGKKYYRFIIDNDKPIRVCNEKQKLVCTIQTNHLLYCLIDNYIKGIK